MDSHSRHRSTPTCGSDQSRSGNEVTSAPQTATSSRSRTRRLTAWATPAGRSSVRTPTAEEEPTATMRFAPVMYWLLTVTVCHDRVTRCYDECHRPRGGDRSDQAVGVHRRGDLE